MKAVKFVLPVIFMFFCLNSSAVEFEVLDPNRPDKDRVISQSHLLAHGNREFFKENVTIFLVNVLGYASWAHINNYPKNSSICSVREAYYLLGGKIEDYVGDQSSVHQRSVYSTGVNIDKIFVLSDRLCEKN